MDTTRFVRGHIEEQDSVASDGLIVEFQQGLQILDFFILAFPPEPARSNGNVTLGRHPASTAFVPAEQGFLGRRVLSRGEALRIHRHILARPH